jgi:hypothetical protein
MAPKVLFTTSNKRSMGETITRETKKRKAKERPKDEQSIGTKKRDRANPSRGRKLSHPWTL